MGEEKKTDAEYARGFADAMKEHRAYERKLLTAFTKSAEALLEMGADVATEHDMIHDERNRERLLGALEQMFGPPPEPRPIDQFLRGIGRFVAGLGDDPEFMERVRSVVMAGTGPIVERSTPVPSGEAIGHAMGINFDDVAKGIWRHPEYGACTMQSDPSRPSPAFMMVSGPPENAVRVTYASSEEFAADGRWSFGYAPRI